MSVVVACASSRRYAPSSAPAVTERNWEVQRARLARREKKSLFKHSIRVHGPPSADSGGVQHPRIPLFFSPRPAYSHLGACADIPLLQSAHAQIILPARICPRAVSSWPASVSGVLLRQWKFVSALDVKKLSEKTLVSCFVDLVASHWFRELGVPPFATLGTSGLT